MEISHPIFLGIDLDKDVESIKRIIADKGIDTHDSEGRTLMHVAAIHGNYELVKWCISEGANATLEDSYESIPLSYAIFKGWVNIADLLKQNMDTEDFDAERSSEFPIDLGTLSNDLGLGIKVSPINLYDDYTYLHISAVQGHLEMFKWLIDNGFDFKHTSQFGLTPLHYATAGGHLELIKQLITPGGLMKDDYVAICKKYLSSKDSINIMMGLAAQGGHVEVMKLLVENGADINYKSPRADVIVKGTPNFNEILVFEGIKADPKLQNYNLLHTPMELASRNGCVEAMKWLEEKGVPIDGHNLIYQAARKGHLDVMKWLHEEKNIPLDPQLMYGAHDSFSVKIMQWLKDKGVDPNVVAKKIVGCNLDHSPAADKVNLEVTRWIVKNIDNPAKIYLSYPKAIASKWDIKLILWAYGHNAIGDLGSDEYRQNAEKFFAVKHCSIEEKIKAGLNLLRAIYDSPSISKELVKVIKSYTNTELNNISPTSTLTDELSSLATFVREELKKVEDKAISNALVNLNNKIEALQEDGLVTLLAQMQIVKSDPNSSVVVKESEHGEEADISAHQESSDLNTSILSQETADDIGTVVLSGEDQEVEHMDI